ncbi:MAG: NADH-quinone oxidoreductase subunit G [Actinobacteria bacterium]|nr:NADH-quinone oxidoreductase subunit G [Actinomycetota bacterium]
MSARPPEIITLAIDGKEVAVPKGTLIIRAAEQLGIEIPRFCDHPLLDPVGACRQCYVEVEGQRKLMTSCTTPVAPGMVVRTQNTSEQAREAQEAVLEFLLLNHPLDCPICDRGGECPLQDQALAFGPGESRYVEPKRTFEKPIALSPLVALDRERCVLCARCTRFCDQISGDRFIELFDRGAAEQVSIAPGEDFRSPFSGNTIQICPVGALTAVPYRFVARPFDLKTADTVCPHCASGCNLRVDLRRGEVVRHLARDSYEVNDAWLCDKGRFAFRFADAPTRLTHPLLRDPGLEPASFGEVFARVGTWLEDGPGRVAFLTGGRLMDEDYYALSKLARTVFRTNDLDHRRYRSGDVPEAVERAAAASVTITYRDVERAGAILVVGLDAEQELPILHLRIRKAARRGAAVFVLNARRTRLHDVAEHVLCPPGAEAGFLERIAGARGEGDAFGRARAALEAAGEGAVVLAGPRLAEAAGGVGRAASLAAGVGGRFAFLARRANDRGALRAGVHPGLLPGGRRVADAGERAEVERAWGLPEGSLPDGPGRDGAAILEAAARREIDVLFLVGVDPLRDFPDAALARRALENVPHKVVQDISSDAMAIYADALLPAAAYLEKDGHYSDWEGRGQRLRPVRAAPGIARPDWEIFAGLARALGGELGFDSLDSLHEEMGELLGPREVDWRPSGRSSAGPALGETGEDLVLFTYPLLVDEGRLSWGAAELKEALEEPVTLEVHPEDAERLGLEDGGRARVASLAGEATLPVRITSTVARGSAFVPFNNPGLAANTLLSGRFHVPVSVAPAGGEGEAEARGVEEVAS